MPEPTEPVQPDDVDQPEQGLRKQPAQTPDAQPETDSAPTEATAEAESAPSEAASEAKPAPIDWRELLRDFIKPGRAQVVFAAILLVLGVGVAMQIRSQTEETDYSSLRRDELVQLLDDLNNQSRQLEAEIAQLEETKRQLQGGADAERVAREEAQRRLDVLSILGGTAPAQGPGIRITIFDPNQKVTPELLLNTVEEMRDAGAEVIAINSSIRVVASTWFASGPNGLLVDGRLVSAPITIDVIGEPQTLTEATRFSGGLVSEVQDPKVGGTVTVVTDQKLTINAVAVPQPNRFAKPA